MSLCELINRFESGEVSDTDLDHALAVNVAEELAQVEENEQQAVLFGDVRILADHLIEQYLVLDQADKARMTEVYVGEKIFQKIGGIQNSKKKKLKEKLGDKNLNLLLHISNYSKLVPIIESYARFIGGADHIRP